MRLWGKVDSGEADPSMGSVRRQSRQAWIAVAVVSGAFIISDADLFPMWAWPALAGSALLFVLGAHRTEMLTCDREAGPAQVRGASRQVGRIAMLHYSPLLLLAVLVPPLTYLGVL